MLALSKLKASNWQKILLQAWPIHNCCRKVCALYGRLPTGKQTLYAKFKILSPMTSYGAVTTESVMIINFFYALCTVTENIFVVTLSMELNISKNQKITLTAK